MGKNPYPNTEKMLASIKKLHGANTKANVVAKQGQSDFYNTPSLEEDGVGMALRISRKLKS